jgi:hypothetical protein
MTQPAVAREEPGWGEAVMLNLDAELVPPPTVRVRAFPDDVRSSAFYLVPVAPSIARDEQGRPEVSFMVYGRRQNEAFRSQGGVLTLTTKLGVSEAEQQEARLSIQRRLAGGRDATELPRIEINAVEWLDGSVAVSLVDSVQLTGRPSLTGPNHCAFNLRLTEQAATALARAWHDGLPGARIRYDMRLRSRQAPSGARLVVEGAFDVSGDELRALAP